MLTLHILEGPDKGRTFRVPLNEPQLIGRSSEALPITDTTVSRRHAELTPDDGRWFVRDLQSQNKTFVNGVEITGRTEVKDGDRIRVGSTVLVVGERSDASMELVELVGDDRLDSEVERRIPSNEDSLVLAEPEPSRAAVDHLRVIYQLTTLTAQVTDTAALLHQVMELVFTELKPERGVIMLVPGKRGVVALPGGGGGGAGGGGAGAAVARAVPRPGEAEVPAEGDIPLAGAAGGGGVGGDGGSVALAALVPAVVRYVRPPADDDEAKIQVSRTILNLVVSEGEGVLSSNAQADPRFRSGDSVQRYNIRSAICSPIRFGERVFGAIYIDSSIANYTFTAEQLALMNAIGQHTALAMANAEQTSRRLQTERLAAIGETVASLSHSIKNIMQGLRGGADVVEMGLKRGDLKLSVGGWEILKRNLDRIVSLTQNMLMFSRQRSVELELTKIGGLIEDCAQLLEGQCAEKGVALIVDVEPEMPPVPIDPNLMHQALMNLMSNAVEAVDAKRGVVTVRAFYHEVGSRRPGLTRPVVEIVVLDNGPGIENDKLQWIFEPFNSTKGTRGTGLGLAVTRRIVLDHQGRIRVETAVGKGSLFRVLIPADLDEQVDPSATAGDRGGGIGEEIRRSV